jgi:hypothetical protein
MKPLDFIAAVVPSAGVLCLAEFSSVKKQHIFVDKVEDLAPAIEKFNNAKYDTYFALASFTEPNSRTAANARYLKSAFMDIDCGEGKEYATKQMAATALDKFLQDTPVGLLGNPWVVSSGGGLHVYWPFTDNVPVPEWKVASENLKRLCKKHNLNIDYTVTADAARVLRVPDTSNWKKKDAPRKVKILVTGGTFDFAQFATAVKEPLNGSAMVLPDTAQTTIDGIAGVRPKRPPTATQVKLNEISRTFFKGIVVRTSQGTGCEQLKYYLENAAKPNMESVWRGLLSWTIKCEDGEGAAKLLTEMHPYTEERMRQKLKDIVKKGGPYKCTTMDSENPGICTNCQHWGKITNPLIFGRTLETDNAEKEIPIQTTGPTQIRIKRPTPPRGFSYGSNGAVLRDVETQDENKNTVIKQVMVLSYELFVVDILSVQKEHFVYMLAMRPEGSVQVTLPQKAVVSKDETVKALASQNIIAAFGAGNDKNLFDYVRGCVELASTSKAAIAVPDGYGWQENHNFVAGGKIFLQNGDVQQIPMQGLENVTFATRPQGTLDAWRKFPQMLIARGMYDILALGCGVGFGSPFMQFSKLGGITFHAGSTESGTGKSMALELAASVWGHPRDYRVGKSTSDVAMQQRAGLLRSLPILSDEITMKNRKDFEWFPGFVFDISEGRGKERMENGANKERVNTSIWSLMALLSSNTHAFDYLSGARKHSSEGEMRRMLEWVATKVLKWSSQEVAIIKSLRDNHGHAGEHFARWMVQNRTVAMDLYDRVEAQIKEEFSLTDDERYWTAGVTSTVSGSIAAGSKHAGIIDLPIRQIIDFYKGLVENARIIVRGNVRTADDVLNAYIREFYGKFINVRVINGAMEATFGEQGIVDESITRTQIAGRVERGVTPGYIDFYLEEQVMKAYCSGMSFGYSDFRKQLEKMYRVNYIKKDMLSKTKGPQMRVNSMKISRLESTLVDKEDE